MVPFPVRETCGCTKWKVALHEMCCLTFSKLSLFRNALLQCEIHILAKFNNPQQVLFRCVKRKLLPYQSPLYFVPDQFSMNGVFLFWFVCLFVVFLIPCLFVPMGRGI